MTDHPDRGSPEHTGHPDLHVVVVGGRRGAVRDRGWASSPSTVLRTHTQSFPLFLKQESRRVRQTDNKPLQSCQVGKVCRFLPSISPLNPRQAGQEEPGSLVDSLILGKNLTTSGSPTGLKVTSVQASGGVGGVGSDHSDVFHVFLVVVSCLMF